jgi:hypothetical protein
MAEVRWASNGLEVRCSGRGFTVLGEGFSVWDERLGSALEDAVLIRRPDTFRPRPRSQVPATLHDSTPAPLRLVPPEKPEPQESPSSHS